MAGEDQVEALTAQIGLLLGEPVTPDQTVVLRSVHRAALISWARKRNMALAPALIGSAGGFTPRALLSGEAPVPASALGAVPSAPAAADAATFGGVGIDMEDVAALPDAEDYREHPFYRDNFTPREIAYCLMQPDVAASFCGTWAAKEAILKSGRVSGHRSHLHDIEITRDNLGRPSFPGCALSISHTKAAAIAICMVSAPQAALASVSPSAATFNAPTAVDAPSRPRVRVMATVMGVVVGVILGGGAVFLAGHV